MYNSISSHNRMCWAGFLVGKSCKKKKEKEKKSLIYTLRIVEKWWKITICLQGQMLKVDINLFIYMCIHKSV